MPQFKRPNRIEFTTWSEEQETYIWNQNTRNFDKVVIDSQAQIDTYEGQDLKTFMEKNNIIPIVTDRQPAYINEAVFKDISLSNVYDSLNTEIVENDQYMEKMAVAQEINNQVVEQQSQPENTKTAENNYYNIKINKETGEVIK